jgi:hypothetical protein
MTARWHYRGRHGASDVETTHSAAGSSVETALFWGAYCGSAASSINVKTGHFYFAKNRIFLLCVDEAMCPIDTSGRSGYTCPRSRVHKL